VIGLVVEAVMSPRPYGAPWPLIQVGRLAGGFASASELPTSGR
jgi:hypothetical protein